MEVRIAAIVEGHGEIETVPVLLRRIAAEVDPQLCLTIETIRVSRSKVVRDGELERSVELAAWRAGPGGGILILLDADDDCPAQLGAALLDRARKARADRATAVVLAKREMEAWFLAATDSLRRQGVLPKDFVKPPDPEAIRGAKERLAGRIDYSPSVDQATLTTKMDLAEARTAPSFDRCCRVVERLLDKLRDGAPTPASR